MRVDLPYLAILAVGLSLAGCSRGPDWREEPGSVAPGPVPEVYSRSLGTAGDHGDRVDQTVLLKRTDQDELEPPEIGGASAIHIWFFPTKTQDGLAWRKGFWVTRIVKTFSFTEEDEMFASTPLLAIGAGDAVDPSRTQAVQAQIQAQQSFVDGIEHRISDLRVPWSEAKPTTQQPTKPAGK